MKGLRLAICCLVLCCAGWGVCASNVQADSMEDNVAVNDTNFPCKSFREYVSEQFDGNKDGVLSREEREQVQVMDVYSEGGKYFVPLSSLKGIEWFPRLSAIRCSARYITEKIDVSKNPELKILVCTDYAAKELDLSSNDKLKEVVFLNSKIESFQISGKQELEVLDFSGSRKLTKLSVSGCPKLKGVYCHESGVKTVRLAKSGGYGMMGLSELDLGGTPLKKLDVRGCPAFKYADVPSRANIKGLKLQKKKQLKEIAISEENFPDPLVRKHLAGKDANKDGKLSRREIKKITHLVLFGDDLKKDYSTINLAGLEYLTELENLTIGNLAPRNQAVLNSLDLTFLKIMDGRWQSLSISSAGRMETLDVRYCDYLTKLQFPDSKSIKYVFFSSGGLREAKFGKTPNLRKLTLENLALKRLTCGGMNRVLKINLMKNSLKKLDLSKCSGDGKHKVKIYCDGMLKIVKKKSFKFKRIDTKTYEAGVYEAETGGIES